MRSSAFCAGEAGPAGENGGLKERLGAEIGPEVAALVGDGAADGIGFEAMETAVRREVLRIADRVRSSGTLDQESENT